MDSQSALDERPKLRPVEAFPLVNDEGRMVAVRDPTGLAEAVLTVSEPALYILSLLDGTRTLKTVGEDFVTRYGQLVGDDTLIELVSNLERAHLLDGPEFQAYVNELVTEYRAAPVRKSVYASELGSGQEVSDYLSKMLDGAPSNQHDGNVVGLIAPHLDYPRGEQCYVAAYARLLGRAAPTRAVVLGTNHSGHSTSVVATGKAFETPLGVTQVDTDFLERLESRCGDLRADEFDHRREHSVELQLVWLQHLFGSDAFRIVPFLCPDPCGPTGMKPANGHGVDLRDFAESLAATVQEDDGDTLVVAGADLSHVGSQFGDSSDLDRDFLASVERRDRRCLSYLEEGDAEAFVQAVAEEGNPTRVCSAGCMFVAATVLRDAKPKTLCYHQAFDERTQICVSCSAVAYTR
ncbi:MAG: AmmeMemoRadiSam system protein B [Planctomycetes bacterium]|nr:AmmeMemoRadiSam system protein B [Planctomycetota bacterium]